MRWDAAADGDDGGRSRPGLVFVLGEGLGIAACVIAIIVYRSNHSGMALWLACCFGGGVLLNGGLVFLGRTVAARAAESPADWMGQLTGRSIPVRDTRLWTASPTSDGGWRWTGGASIPHWLGRLNASNGLAVLDLGPQGLTFRVRLGRLFGATPLQVEPSVDVLCFPVRGTFLRRGVAVQPPGQRPWYFWNGAVSEILSTLGWAGFAVTWEERKARLW